MPTLAAHSFGNDQYETFLRIDDTCAGGFLTTGPLSKIVSDVRTILAHNATPVEALSFRAWYGEESDRKEFDRVIEALREKE